MTTDPLVLKCQSKPQLPVTDLFSQQDPTGCEARAAQADINREAANLQELLSRLTGSVTPLSISSKAAQVVLRQF
jgi:hypothetical protein